MNKHNGQILLPALVGLPLEGGDLEHGISGGANANPLDVNTHELLNPPDVVLGVHGEVFELAHPGNVLLPSWQRLVDDLDLAEHGQISGHALQDLAVVAVVDSDLDLLEGVEDIELGQVDAGKIKTRDK